MVSETAAKERPSGGKIRRRASSAVGKSVGKASRRSSEPDAVTCLQKRKIRPFTRCKGTNFPLFS